MRMLVFLRSEMDLQAMLIDTVQKLRGQSSEDPKPSTEEAIRLFGVQNTRNFLVAYELKNFVKSKLLAVDPKTGRLATRPEKLLKFANLTLESFGEDSRYKDVAYNSGLLYDLVLFTIYRDGGADQTKLEELLTKTHAYAVKVAQRAIQIGAKISSLKLEKQLVTVCLLSELGFVLNVLDHPGLLDKFKAILPTDFFLPTRMAIEENVSKMSRTEIGFRLASCFPILMDGAQGLFYLNRAYAIAEISPDAYALAATAFASFMALDSGAINTALEGGASLSSLRPELEEFNS